MWNNAHKVQATHNKWLIYLTGGICIVTVLVISLIWNYGGQLGALLKVRPVQDNWDIVGTKLCSRNTDCFTFRHFIEKWQDLECVRIPMLLLLLYSCPLDRAVWPNYEVVMLQPRSGTATSLGYVDIIVSYLKTPYYRSTFFWIRPLHPPFPDPASHSPPWDWSAPLFAPNFTPAFQSCIVWQKKRIFSPNSTARPVISAFMPLNCSPGLCCHLQPWTASPFMPYCTPSDRPLFATLDVAINPVKPRGLSLLGYVLPPPFPEPPLPPLLTASTA